MTLKAAAKQAAASTEDTERCANSACKCPDCECGPGCTCGVSPDVVCDPCKDFKKLMAANTGASKSAVSAADSDMCMNSACKCPDCECGSGCTCGISLDVVCDPCKDFKKQMAAKAAASKPTESDVVSERCVNSACKCPDCECGSGCTCGISPDVVCDPCKDFKKQMAAKAAASKPTESDVVSERCVNSACKCPDCECGSGCTCGISPDVVCDPCNDFKNTHSSAASPEQNRSLRYSRQMLVKGFGSRGQTLLENVGVLVVGAGGLGYIDGICGLTYFATHVQFACAVGRRCCCT